MSKELFVAATPGLTLYIVLLDPAGQAWNGSWCEELTPANWLTYSVPLTQVAPTSVYFGDMPAGLDPAVYKYLVYQQIYPTPATSDVLIGVGSIRWVGAAVEPVRTDSMLRDVFGLTAANLSSLLTDMGAAIEGVLGLVSDEAIGDAVLLRDWADIDGDVPARSALNALRFLRNAWAVDPSGNLVVAKEDDATIAWQATLMTGPGASPVIGSLPTAPLPPEFPM